MKLRSACLPLACLLLVTSTALAHKPSDSYLTLRVANAQISGEWHLALRDLDYALGLDANDDGAITWRELRAQQPAIVSYALARLQIGDGGGAGHIRVTQLLVDNHSDGAYAVLRFKVDDLTLPSSGVDVRYSAFFDIDPLHRGLLRVETDGSSQVAVFGPETARQHVAFTNATAAHSLPLFLREGIWHIWTGYDHILFLLALMLPAALERRSDSVRQGNPALSLNGGLKPAFLSKSWSAQPAIRPVLSEVLKTVSAFTLAHSITLSLAAFGLVRLPSRLIESTIAASVILAALHNVRPFLSQRGWVIAFTFGLVHGFGFANALADLGLHRAVLAPALFGFNLGVETGQLAIVSLCLPFALLLRHRPFYSTTFLPAGSLAIAAVAGVWFFERACNLNSL